MMTWLNLSHDPFGAVRARLRARQDRQPLHPAAENGQRRGEERQAADQAGDGDDQDRKRHRADDSRIEQDDRDEHGEDDSQARVGDRAPAVAIVTARASPVVLPARNSSRKRLTTISEKSNSPAQGRHRRRVEGEDREVGARANLADDRDSRDHAAGAEQERDERRDNCPEDEEEEEDDDRDGEMLRSVSGPARSCARGRARSPAGR